MGQHVALKFNFSLSDDLATGQLSNRPTKSSRIVKEKIMKALFTAIVLSATLAASGASAQGANLSGRWQCMAQCLGPPGGFAFITQNGWELNIVNDVGIASRAWEDYPGHIWIERVNMGALYSPNGFTLQFDNGTIWQRAPELPPPPPPRVRSRG
jgi:hypothetical protein